MVDALNPFRLKEKRQSEHRGAPPTLSPSGAFPATWLMVLASIALSVWQIYSDPRINTDGVLYLMAAGAVAESGLSASFDIYQWPFFHIAIALLHKATGLSLLISANVLMTACYALLVPAFCRLVRNMGGDKVTLTFAFLLILCHPISNEFRNGIVRDPGMWAFLLLAMAEQVRFTKTPTWPAALAWGGSMLVATLFRVEALALALFAPLALLLATAHPLHKRFALALQLLALPVAALATAILLTLCLGHGGEIKLVSDLEFMLTQSRALATGMSSATQAMGSQVLADFSVKDAPVALVAAMLAVTLLNLLRAITLPYLLPLLAARKTWPGEIDATTKTILASYALIIGSYLFAFTLFAHFNLSRYCLQLGLVALAVLPFALRHWWLASNRKNLVRGLIIVLLAANALDTLISSGHKKAYILAAATWARDSDQIAPGSLVSNEPYIAYFSNKATDANIFNAINPGRVVLSDREHTHWLAGKIYAQRLYFGAESDQLAADIAAGEGKILKAFDGGDHRRVIFFSVRRDLPRAAVFLDNGQ